MLVVCTHIPFPYGAVNILLIEFGFKMVRPTTPFSGRYHKCGILNIARL